MNKSKAKNTSIPRKNRVALVLQGGGALGAYQAGVYQALDENGLCPDWIIGTSIGAINAALIAGNSPAARLTKLKEFWALVSQNNGLDMGRMVDSARRLNIWMSTLDVMASGVEGFFSPRIFSPFVAGLAVAPENASFYDTQELGNTLEKLIDLDFLNGDNKMRLTVNALKVTTGELISFDSSRQRIGIEHVMASGALPPGFPPVRVGGELYWDGGLYSNTPIETVLDDKPPMDTLCFMVDLWNANGPEPTTFDEVQTRQKDVMYASRSKRHIDAYIRTHNLQCALRELYKKLPAQEKKAFKKEFLAELIPETTMHIVRLAYPGRDWNMASKDINFAKGSITWRWEQGYRDACRAIEQAGWLAAVTGHSSVVVHEVDDK